MRNVTRASDVMRRVAGGLIVLVGVYFGYTGLWSARVFARKPG